MNWLLKLLPQVTITVDGKPYLTRYTLMSIPFENGAVFLHHFHSSDRKGGDYHNHPWKWAYALILKGGYWEHYCRPDLGQVFGLRTRRPGCIIKITKKLFHKVELFDEEQGSWSLFICGKRDSEWGFLHPKTLEYTDWRENPEAIP